MTYRRAVTVRLPLLGDVCVLVMSGKQRDLYFRGQMKLRESIANAAGLSPSEYDALTETERTAKATAVIQSHPELMDFFNEQQYQLIAWCFVTPEHEAVFGSAEEASSELDYEQATELSKACAEVNKLLPEQEKQDQLDFFETRKGESGTD
jgi:phosphopantetheine adenylyltransferase